MYLARVCKVSARTSKASKGNVHVAFDGGCTYHINDCHLMETSRMNMEAW